MAEEDQRMADQRLYDVFLIYSSEDRSNSTKIEEELAKVGLSVCIHERDFVPGVTVLANIHARIPESRTYVVIIPECEKGFPQYEVEIAIFHSIVTYKKPIPIFSVVIDERKVPQMLQNYARFRLSDQDWPEKLIAAIKKPVEYEKKGIAYNVISVSQTKSELNDEIKSSLGALEVKQIQKIQIMENGQNNNLRYAKDDSEELLSSIESVEKAVDLTDSSVTVLIVWICQKFKKESMCQDFLKTLLLSLKDKKPSPTIIPVLTKGSTPIDPIKDISGLPYDLEEKEFRSRLKRAVYTACTGHLSLRGTTHIGLSNFPKSSPGKSEREFDLRCDRKIFRVSEIEGTFDDDNESARYLGVSFTWDGHLVLLDADNRCLKKMTITGRPIKKLPLEEMPNRFSQIDRDLMALIYRDESTILIIDTAEMKIKETRNISDEHGNKATLKGITALDKDTMIVTANSKNCSLNIALVKQERIHMQIEVDSDGYRFSMPRRLTSTDENTIIVADENDRRLALLKYDAKSPTLLNLTFAMKRWNKNLYNVRGLAVDSGTVYVAACNGINTFDIETETLSKEPLIRFRSDVLHTRALSLHSSRSRRKYLAVSLAVQGPPVKDIIRVFDITA